MSEENKIADRIRDEINAVRASFSTNADAFRPSREGRMSPNGTRYAFVGAEIDEGDVLDKERRLFSAPDVKKEEKKSEVVRMTKQGVRDLDGPQTNQRKRPDVAVCFHDWRAVSERESPVRWIGDNPVAWETVVVEKCGKCRDHRVVRKEE